jgi:hypothetical protein
VRWTLNTVTQRWDTLWNYTTSIFYSTELSRTDMLHEFDLCRRSGINIQYLIWSIASSLRVSICCYYVKCIIQRQGCCFPLTIWGCYSWEMALIFDLDVWFIWKRIHEINQGTLNSANSYIRRDYVFRLILNGWCTYFYHLNLQCSDT